MNLTDRSNRLIIGGARIATGLLWLANLHWKRPPNFGKSNGSGLYKYVKYGIDHPTFPPYSWILRHVIAPHMSLFGWTTLLLEASIAALLILGWHTKPVALLAAGQAAAIGLSVAQAPNEWPWSYVLMVFVHLLLFATDAGKFGGLDALRADGHAARRGVLVLGTSAIVVGLAALVASAGSPFTDRGGSLVGQVSYELKFARFNLFAAVLCLTIGAVALLGWKLRQRALLWGAAGLALLCAVQVVVQWRTTASGETGGILGATGGTLGWWLVLAIGFAVTARADEA